MVILLDSLDSSDILCEAIANAVIHRDYTVEGSTNYLFISDSKIIL